MEPASLAALNPVPYAFKGTAKYTNRLEGFPEPVPQTNYSTIGGLETGLMALPVS